MTCHNEENKTPRTLMRIFMSNDELYGFEVPCEFGG